MARKNIYDKDLGYSLLRPIVDWHTKASYRKIEVRGEENLPTDGPVILAANHCNTLMDALVVPPAAAAGPEPPAMAMHHSSRSTATAQAAVSAGFTQ